MFEVLLKNIELISILILAYLGSLGINTLLGIYYNLKTLKETFSREKLITGLVRGGIVLIGGLAITVIVSLLPEILSAFGVTASNELFENLSITAMAGILASTIVHYLSDAVKKFYAILNSHTVIEESEPQPELEEK